MLAVRVGGHDIVIRCPPRDLGKARLQCRSLPAIPRKADDVRAGVFDHREEIVVSGATAVVDDQDIQVGIGGKQFVNIGSLTRGSLSQDNLDRIPSAAVLRCTEQGVEIEVKPLNVRPAEEVFDVEGRARQVKR